jgi:hypothetical protein
MQTASISRSRPGRPWEEAVKGGPGMASITCTGVYLQHKYFTDLSQFGDEFLTVL